MAAGQRGGSFTFSIKTAPDAVNTLICTYWGMDNRGRTFDMFINDQKIATGDPNRYKESRFYDSPYRIPKQLTTSKQQVTVSFRPQTRNQAGPVYGIRLVRS